MSWLKEAISRGRKDKSDKERAKKQEEERRIKKSLARNKREEEIQQRILEDLGPVVAAIDPLFNVFRDEDDWEVKGPARERWSLENPVQSREEEIAKIAKKTKPKHTSLRVHTLKGDWIEQGSGDVHVTTEYIEGIGWDIYKHLTDRKFSDHVATLFAYKSRGSADYFISGGVIERISGENIRKTLSDQVRRLESEDH